MFCVLVVQGLLFKETFLLKEIERQQLAERRLLLLIGTTLSYKALSTTIN